ncbi:MAG: hypothetical protein M3N08_01415 [Pseudomonadota bacterium]|nr:hypothetical protein [Pseudomonadota bacterium]
MGILLSLFLIWQAGHRHTLNCEAANVQVTVTPMLGDTAYDFSADVLSIQAMANGVVHQVRAGWALGLTDYVSVLSMEAPIAVTPRARGTFCAAPQRIGVVIGYKNVTVHMPRELSGDSCGFQQILAHENKHLMVNREVTQKFSALAETKIRSYLATNGGVEDESADAAAGAARHGLQALLQEIAWQMLRENEAGQIDVDGPEEYRRLLSVCDGELADLVKRTRDERRLAASF